MISKDNRLVKKAQKLKKKKYREEEGLFLAEGIRFVEAAILKGVVKYILYSSKALKTKGYERVIKDSLECYEIEDAILTDICDTENPQGVVAICEKPKHFIENINGNTIVIVDGVQDPGNLGTIIRTCDAAGVSGVIILKGTVDLFNPKVLRSTMGSIFHLPIFIENDINKAFTVLREREYSILATNLFAEKSLYDYDFSKKTAIVLGNEANGVSDEVLNLATELIIIPMEGEAESLNVGIANSIIVYEALRQRITRVN